MGSLGLREKCVTLVSAWQHLWAVDCSERAKKCCVIMPLRGLACMGCKGSSVRITPSRPLFRRLSHLRVAFLFVRWKLRVGERVQCTFAHHRFVLRFLACSLWHTGFVALQSFIVSRGDLKRC